jgi:hypothetical protein
MPVSNSWLKMGLISLIEPWIARVLTNSKAFHDLHTNSQSDTIEPGCCPLGAPTTEGLFAALYFLSEQAERLSQLPLPQPTPLHSSDVPY